MKNSEIFTKRKIVVKVLKEFARYKFLRKHLLRKADKILYNFILKDDDYLKSVQLKKYQFMSAMIHSAGNNIDKKYISRHVLNKLIEVLVENSFLNNTEEHKRKFEMFTEKYGNNPPNFIVLSPSQRCNLHCTGCYASSDKETSPTLPYSIVDRIVGEVHDLFDSRFITISGGEPFMYKSEGKTLLDIFEKYNDMFFLVYTNGTFITTDVAKKLSKLGNVTPAISVEGYEKETDERRGKGIYKKVLAAFKNLREVGVPFGISVTATSKNYKLLLTDEFYDFYFKKLGVTYMWQFQLMPIGRAKDTFDLMVSPENRIKLYEIWKRLLIEKKYCVADFWNSAVLTNGCIAYGRHGGYFYIDWNGNIMPCVFVPYYVDNIYELYKNGKSLGDAVNSEFMKNGRKWQDKYGLKNLKFPDNLLMPCSIRDHYEIFRKSIMTKDTKSEDVPAEKSLKDKEYYNELLKYDNELESLSRKVWEEEYLNKG